MFNFIQLKHTRLKVGQEQDVFSLNALPAAILMVTFSGMFVRIRATSVFSPVSACAERTRMQLTHDSCVSQMDGFDNCLF